MKKKIKKSTKKLGAISKEMLDAVDKYTTGPILVVAGDLSQAREWAENNSLDANNSTGKWAYAVDQYSLRGWIPSKVVYYGTWNKRSDWEELRQELFVLQQRMTAAGIPTGSVLEDILLRQQVVGKDTNRVVLGEGTFACDTVYACVRDEKGWRASLNTEAHELVGKRVRLIAEILE